MLHFHGLDILSTKQFSREDLEHILKTIEKMEPIAQGKKVSTAMKGKVLASLFFEPSTRTRLSFETAMLRLGGSVISMAEANTSSSVTKGETLTDMARVVGGYADVIAMRHPEEGSVATFAAATATPVLNAGDGPGEHPTQAFIDVYTIQKEKKAIDGLTIGMCGDLRNGRTVHSLAALLYHYNVKFVFITPEELHMPTAITQALAAKGMSVTETNDFEGAIADLDVLYMTRVQKERFVDQAAYKKFAGAFQLTEALMKKAKKDLIVMHPLPRVTEITPGIDTDPRARYFAQALNGVPVRMALLSLVTGTIK